MNNKNTHKKYVQDITKILLGVWCYNFGAHGINVKLLINLSTNSYSKKSAYIIVEKKKEIQLLHNFATEHSTGIAIRINKDKSKVKSLEIESFAGKDLLLIQRRSGWALLKLAFKPVLRRLNFGHLGLTQIAQLFGNVFIYSIVPFELLPARSKRTVL